MKSKLEIEIYAYLMGWADVSGRKGWRVWGLWGMSGGSYFQLIWEGEYFR